MHLGAFDAHKQEPTTLATDGAADDSRAEDRSEKVLLTFFLAVRAVHLVQGALCVSSGWRSYRRPRFAAASLGVGLVEFGWMIRQSWPTGRYHAREAWIDTAIGLGGLTALGLATTPEDRTASMNWMLPYTVGGVGGIALGMANRSTGTKDGITEGAIATGLLAAAYTATVAPTVRSGGGRAATALANITSYGGFFAVTHFVARFMRRGARELDVTRREALERGVRLAAERERNRQHRMLHDSALQTLEAIGAGPYAEPATAARAEAARLRRALDGDPADDGASDLATLLGAMAVEFEHQGLRVELVCTDLDGHPSGASARLLADSAREALTNVVKHAGTGSVVLRAARTASGSEVTIRDHGKGFDTETAHRGFGLEHSIRERLSEAGGGAEIWSQPGRGTRVRMWLPAM